MKTKSSFPSLAASALLALSATLPAHATTYLYSSNGAGSVNGGAGNITAITTTYDDVAHTLTWSTTLTSESGTIADGFWLVLSDGPNPKGLSDQLPIYYFDATNSFDPAGNYNGLTPTLTAYGYNGLNANSSYLDPGVGLMSSISGVAWNSNNQLTASGSLTSRTFSFSLDVSNLDSSLFVNSRYTAAGVPFDPANWEGAGYDSSIGIWYHATESGGADPIYNSEGFLKDFPAKSQSYYDISDGTTTVVPEPSSAWLVALAGLVLVHRRRSLLNRA